MGEDSSYREDRLRDFMSEILDLIDTTNSLGQLLINQGNKSSTEQLDTMRREVELMNKVILHFFEDYRPT